MSEFWNWWVIVIVVVNIAGCLALLLWTRKIKVSKIENDETTGHVYDGIEEYNNPLPRWWINLFYITIIFSIGYLILYPGMGNFKGTLNWTQENQLVEEVKKAEAVYQPLFEKYSKISVAELSKIDQATKMGKRIFVNTCFGCHGSDARGNPGYPDLTDKNWLWGGSAEQIETSILNGRMGIMPPFGGVLSAEQVSELVQYVGKLSGNNVDEEKAAAGKITFETQCFVCHGMTGTGNMAMGAPNLTDDIWLYGGSGISISQTIREGRKGEMPAHADILGKDRVHLVAAYVYSLSNQ